MDSILTQMDTFWQNDPYTAAALICGFKASAADMIAQQQASPADVSAPSPPAEKETLMKIPFTASSLSSSSSAVPAVVPAATSSSSSAEYPITVRSHHPDWLDAKRNLAFVIYGALYQGMVHEYVFNTLYPAWFGVGTDPAVVLCKVLFNLLIQTTLVTLPVAYILKAYIVGKDCTNNRQPQQSQQKQQKQKQQENPLQTAMEKYWNDIQYQGLWTKAFALWGPVHCLTFSVVPEHYRVTFIAVVSFFWLIMLSSISSTDATSTTTATRAKQ